MGVVFAAAAACLLAASMLMAGVGREPFGLMSTATVAQVQGSTGHDFVPFGSDGSAQMTATAKMQLDGLFAAAGVKMASTTPKARQSMLAEVSKSAAKQHVNLDSGSSERLVAAAENRLHAFDRKVHFSNNDKRVQRLKHDLGSKIAQYFEAAHNKL